MLRTSTRWGLVGLAALVVGPVAASLTRGIPAPDGGAGGTALASAAPVAGVVRAALAIAIAVGWGALTSRLAGWRPGFLAAGIVVAWAGGASGAAGELLHLTRDAALLNRFAIEGALLVGLGAAGSLLILRMDPHAGHAPTASGARAPDAPGVGSLILALVAAIAVGGLAAWCVALDSLHGQTLAAAVVAAVAIAVVARVIAHRRVAALCVAAVALLAVAAPVIAANYQSADLLPALFAGRLFPPARIAPLDWLAGAYIGVPIGAAWAESMLHRSAPA